MYKCIVHLLQIRVGDRVVMLKVQKLLYHVEGPRTSQSCIGTNSKAFPLPSCPLCYDMLLTL